jgi:hypothetical protein
MNPFRRRSNKTEQIEDKAISHLVARHPRDYVTQCATSIQAIPNGGSIIPWRYRRQLNVALATAENQFVATHIDEYIEIVSMLAAAEDLAHLTPEDFHP